MKLRRNQFFCPTLVLLAVLFCLPACSCDKNQALNVTWILEKYGPAASPTAVIPAGSTKIELTLNNNNKFTGNDGCNAIFGSYAFGKNCHVRFDSIMSTLIACQPDIMNQASAVTHLLHNVETFSVSGTQLKLCTSANEVLQYRKK